MHEFSIAQALVEVASAEARGAGASRVIWLSCRIGVLRHVEHDLMHEAFRIARADSPCRDAVLEIETAYMHVRCPRCDRRFPVREGQWHCPACHVEGRNPTGGDELELLRIEAELDHAYRRPAQHLSA